MSVQKDVLFSPSRMGNVTLKNRFAVAPMTRVSATEAGTPTEQMATYYERFAKGGFGLLITEGLYTDQQYSQGYLFQPGISDLAQAQAWTGLVKRLHAHDTKVVAQLMHAGALNQGNRFVSGTLAPSVMQPKGEQMSFYYGKGEYPVPSAATDAQIADAIEGFANAAQRATEVAGFDGVEIHAANGYLLDQFLTDYANQRTDKWGGDVNNRIRLILEVLAAVRKTMKPGAALGVRVSQGKVNDFQHKWASEHEAEVIFCSMADAGVDYIHVTEHEAWRPAFEGGTDSLATLARRYAPSVTLLTNGSLHELDRSVELLAKGADVIAFGRGALANPDLPGRIARGEALREFDPAILGPIANIKASELA
ncbi:MAG TPA: NADH:flavin oxidoreductase [Pseudomonas sp.]|uniref:NADH:flavin oxidoreductase n=1 Tax=Pseudomonas sp. TaxID=306 RepID=UPI002B488599|nr:NADH:flavin oxidoreductase [Pseudomonas sp.]HKS12205.1 NADH:flavin oxidoreductase [Pseudomonas sp.]